MAIKSFSEIIGMFRDLAFSSFAGPALSPARR
jgi:hypothetical protein